MHLSSTMLCAFLALLVYARAQQPESSLIAALTRLKITDSTKMTSKKTEPFQVASNPPKKVPGNSKKALVTPDKKPRPSNKVPPKKQPGNSKPPKKITPKKEPGKQKMRPGKPKKRPKRCIGSGSHRWCNQKGDEEEDWVTCGHHKGFYCRKRNSSDSRRRRRHRPGREMTSEERYLRSETAGGMGVTAEAVMGSKKAAETLTDLTDIKIEPLGKGGGGKGGGGKGGGGKGGGGKGGRAKGAGGGKGRPSGGGKGRPSGGGKGRPSGGGKGRPSGGGKGRPSGGGKGRPSGGGKGRPSGGGRGKGGFPGGRGGRGGRDDRRRPYYRRRPRGRSGRRPYDRSYYYYGYPAGYTYAEWERYRFRFPQARGCVIINEDYPASAYDDWV